MLGSHVFDSLTSFISGLGDPAKDKSASVFYGGAILNDVELSNAYESSWISEKIVDIPAQDCFRKWRNWQGDSKQVEAIAKLEATLGLQAKMLQCKKLARLWGGAAIFIGTDDEDVSEELDPSKIGKGGLKYLNVFSRKELKAGPLVQDPVSDRYGLPEYYEVSGQGEPVKIHPSRLVVQIGKEHASPFEVAGETAGWGKSVIQAAFSAVKNADSTSANIASLIFEANVDVFGVPDLLSKISDSKFESKLLKRFQLANMAKSVHRALIRDKNEEFDRKQISFSSLPEIIEKFWLAVCGAADIPMTRFFGRSPSGMSSTGESDLANYHDKIQSMQTLEVGPAAEVLDECIVWSALGYYPEGISYEWVPLKQMSEKEIAEIGKIIAETISSLVDSAVIDDNELREVAINQLTENKVFPGLAAIAEKTGKLEREEQ